jgi:hypothetical protein
MCEAALMLGFINDFAKASCLTWWNNLQASIARGEVRELPDGSFQIIKSADRQGARPISEIERIMNAKHFYSSRKARKRQHHA